MPIIYFENFRGFQATYLHLKDVNFFVGENSTGKTSVLKLIGILSSQGFWRYGEFGKEETSLGGFADIITSIKQNKNESADTHRDYFELGIMSEPVDEDDLGFLIKLRFIENDNFPSLKEISYKVGDINIQAITEGKIIKFRYSLNEKQPLFTLEEFKVWISDNKLNNIIFDRVPVEYMGIIPILTQLRSVIISKAERNPDALKGSVITRMVLPHFLNSFAWIAPIRAEPQRTYHRQGLIYNSEGRHSLSVLKEILTGPNVKTILNRFGYDSGLFEDISIKDFSDDTDTFEVLIYINGEARNITNVGYGVSQILPIIIETIARQDNTWFATQQPEVHLHPKAQAAFGDFIFKSNQIDKQKFIIETHSDYTIDRFRLRINRAFREGKEHTESIGQVVFFSKSEMGNELKVIELGEDGSYPEDQPRSFRNFFIKEQLEIISI